LVVETLLWAPLYAFFDARLRFRIATTKKGLDTIVCDPSFSPQRARLSFATGQISAISNRASIYGVNSYPSLADAHIYSTSTNSAGDYLYAAAHNFETIGPLAGQYRWIIGESNFNNAIDAQSMAAQLAALASNDSKPFYLMQWPIDPNNAQCTVGNVAPFGTLEAYGF